jgi:hypothetical protein
VIPLEPMREMVVSLTDRLQAVYDWEPMPEMGLSSREMMAYLILSISPGRIAGVDEIRQTFNETTQSLNSTLTGVRLLTLSLKAISYQKHIPAFIIAMQMRARMRSKTAQDALSSMNGALVALGPVTRTDSYNDNGRLITSAVTDLRLSFGVNIPLTDDDGGIIETVNGNDVVPVTVTP